MSMPNFFGSLADAVAEGQICVECHWCKNWTWTDKTGTGRRRFCTSKRCELREQAERAVETGDLYKYELALEWARERGIDTKAWPNPEAEPV